MKNLSIAGVLAGVTLIAPLAHADTFAGSDTLKSAILEAISQAEQLQVLPVGALVYTGGGSGVGEAGLRAGTQGIAPMSRAFSTAAINDLLSQGVTPVTNAIGLDGVSVFAEAGNATPSIDFATLRGIFGCTITTWEQVPGATLTGPIAVYRRDDASGTTDTFKTLTGLAAFGTCATIVPSTEAIASHTSTEANAIGYAGLSGKVAGNKELAVVSPVTGAAVLPTVANIRDFSYPLSRRLFVNSVADGRSPSALEQSLTSIGPGRDVGACVGWRPVRRRGFGCRQRRPSSA